MIRGRRFAAGQDEESEADREWRRNLWPECRQPGDREPSGAELLRRFGKPSWNALLYRDLAEQREAEAEIRRYNATHNKSRNSSQ